MAEPGPADPPARRLMEVWNPPPPPDRPATGWRRRWPLLTLTSGVGVVLLGAAITWTWYRDFTDHPPDRADRSALLLPLPDRPSVVVLPFAPASTREADVLHARQLAADFTAGLARNRGLFVIAPETASRLRGGQFRIKATAEALGVAALLTAVLTETDSGTRAFLQIIDAFTGEPDWSHTAVLDPDRLHALPGQVLPEVVEELGGGTDGPPVPGPSDHAAWIAHAEATQYRVPGDRDSMAASLARLREAERADAGWSTVPAERAWIWLEAARRGWIGFGGSSDRAALIEAGLVAAERALQLDPGTSRAAALRADLLTLAGRGGEALEWRERAARTGPNSFRAHWDLAEALAAEGSHRRAVSAMSHALRLHPRHPVAMDLRLAELQFLAGQGAESLAALERVLAKRPADPEPHLMQIRILAAGGEHRLARQRAGQLLKLYPDFSVDAWLRQRARRGLPDRADWRSVLIEAGVPG